MKLKVATSLTAREINRRTVFCIVRERQPLSRADVARLTGLQRSTVSSIADQLIEEGWLREGGSTRLPRGRRPIRLHVNETQGPHVIAIDIRPVLTSIALANLEGVIATHESFPTPPEPKLLLHVLSEKVTALREKCESVLAGIGVSLPGRVDATGKLAIAPNLGWENVDIAGPLSRSTELPVICENAANAYALAELHFSKSHKGNGDIVAVTVSEGVGTGVIVDGRLLGGLAAEFGHTSIETEGLLCRCGNHGCWEMYASNLAALRYFNDQNGKAGTHRQKTAAKASEQSFEEYQRLLTLAGDGDNDAMAALQKQGQFLGVGIANLIRGFTPSRIMILGEVTRAWQLIQPAIDAELNARIPTNLARPVINPANSELFPRLRGAAALVVEQQFGMMTAPAG